MVPVDLEEIVIIAADLACGSEEGGDVVSGDLGEHLGDQGRLKAIGNLLFRPAGMRKRGGDIDGISSEFAIALAAKLEPFRFPTCARIRNVGGVLPETVIARKKHPKEL
jgi:hypothetical protein